MKLENVLYEKEGQIAHVTLNRPERLNAVSPELVRDWEAAIDEAEKDDDIKVVVFKGAGRAFSAGADLTGVGYVYGMKDPKPGEKSKERIPQRVKLDFDRYMFLEFTRRVLFCTKITIAQLHTYCLGVAFNTVLHCDLLIASEDCRMGHVEERLGLGGMTISPLMVLRCGLTNALYLCLTGKMVDGREAVDLGLVNRAVPADDLDREVRELAEGLALHPKDGIAFGKAARHMMYETMGCTQGLSQHYVMHTLQTNRVYDPDEFNFFKQRRDKGVKDAAREKHDLFKALDK